MKFLCILHRLKCSYFPGRSALESLEVAIETFSEARGIRTYRFGWRIERLRLVQCWGACPRARRGAYDL